MTVAINASRDLTPTENAESPSFASNVTKAYKVFEETIWEYINQSAKAARFTMKAVVIKVPEYAERLTNIIAKVSLLSGVSVLLALKGLPGQLESWYKNIAMDDPEGAILASFGLLATLGDILDTLGTFVGGLTDLGAIPKIAFFGLIGFPLAIGLLCYALLNKAYQFFHHGRFLSSLPQEITAENMAEFEKFLKSSIDGAQKVHMLTRYTDSKVCNIMKNLVQHLENNPNDVVTANQALQDMQAVMGRKITLGSVASVMNLALLIALVALSAINPLILPLTLAAKAVVALSCHIYKSHFIDVNLNLPEMIKA